MPGPAGWDRWHAVQRPSNGMALYLYDAATRTPRTALGRPRDRLRRSRFPCARASARPVIASQLAGDAPKEGSFLLTDVYRGLTDVQRGEIKVAAPRGRPGQDASDDELPQHGRHAG